MGLLRHCSRQGKVNEHLTYNCFHHNFSRLEYSKRFKNVPITFSLHSKQTALLWN